MRAIFSSTDEITHHSKERMQLLNLYCNQAINYKMRPLLIYTLEIKFCQFSFSSYFCNRLRERCKLFARKALRYCPSIKIANFKQEGRTLMLSLVVYAIGLRLKAYLQA